MPEGAAIQKLFAKIAKRYDSANILLSGGLSRYWSRKLCVLAARERPTKIADLATGSGEVAFELKRLCPDAKIQGFDFCEEMLAVARKRSKDILGAETITFAYGDCLALPLDENAVDVVTIAYGVRNFEDRPRGLREIHRVLRPGGKAFILEFTQPLRWFRPFYFLYLKGFLALIARVITGNKKAYDYLVGSIATFPPKEQISEELRAAGFVSVRALGLTASAVAIHIAEK